jgi:hypothetical protein
MPLIENQIPEDRVQASGKDFQRRDEGEFADPEIPVPQIIFNPDRTLIEPSLREVARQIRLIFHASYCSIQPSELMSFFQNGGLTSRTGGVASFLRLGDSLNQLLVETFLQNDKVEAYQRILEIAEKLLEPELNDFDAAGVLCVF